MARDNTASAVGIDQKIDQYDPSEFEMPYGRHAGIPVSEVPTQYLRWMYMDWNFRYYPKLQRAIERRLGLTPDPQIRMGTTKPPPQGSSRGQFGAKGSPNGGYRGTAMTGLDGFRAAFDRTRNAALAEYQDEPEIRDLLEDVLGRVRTALGI